MKHLLALFLLVMPLSAQVAITTNATIQSASVPVFRWLLEQQFLAAVDTDQNGTVTNAEGLAWLSGQKIQKDLVEKYVKDAILKAESKNRAILPQALQDALAAKDAAEADIQAQRELLCPGCWE